MRHHRRGELAIPDVELDDLRVVGDFDTQRSGGPVIGVEQRLPAAQEKRIGAREL